MKKILVVFTGGTIGSSVSGHTIDTAASNRFKLLAGYRERYARATQVEFETISPVEILSENLNPMVWTQVMGAIDAYDLKDIAGIIVTHGTDTLAFSACALSYYYQNLGVPLLLVSSDFPLTDARANGLDNFDVAVAFILDRLEKGVFVAYRNQGQSAQIHLGTRLASCLQLSSEFMSVQAKAYLHFIDNQFSEQHPPTRQKQPQPLKATFSTRVVMVKPYPGLNYEVFDLSGVEAVLHDLYHSGTACVSATWGERYSLLSFIKRCISEGVSVYLAPGLSSAEQYSSTQALLDLGAVMLWDMTLEAAYVKLLMAYGNFSDFRDIKNVMQRNIAHEIL